MNQGWRAPLRRCREGGQDRACLSKDPGWFTGGKTHRAAVEGLERRRGMGGGAVVRNYFFDPFSFAACTWATRLVYMPITFW